ncbi:hypothetical protein [Thermococcus sp.]
MGPKTRKLLVGLGIAAVFFVTFSLALYESGYTLTGYFPSKSLNAKRYAPILYTPQDDKPEEILYMYNKTTHAITYYVIWGGEYTGRSVIDRLYEYIRSLFYGSGADVEPITVYSLNRTISFETSGHTEVWATFSGTVCKYDDTYIPNCTVNGTHVRVYVLTWNHLFTLEPQSGTHPVSIEVKPMSPTDYIRYSVGRRGESIAEGVVRAILIALLSTVLIVVASGYFLGKKKGWEKIRKKFKKGS